MHLFVGSWTLKPHDAQLCTLSRLAHLPEALKPLKVLSGGGSYPCKNRTETLHRTADTTPQRENGKTKTVTLNPKPLEVLSSSGPLLRLTPPISEIERLICLRPKP